MKNASMGITSKYAANIAFFSIKGVSFLKKGVYFLCSRCRIATNAAPLLT